MSDLRARIAAVQAQHHHWDYAGDLTCACGESFGMSDAGWEAAVQEWAQHVADAVIGELRLQLAAWARMCVDSGDMTPAAKRMLHNILGQP